MRRPPSLGSWRTLAGLAGLAAVGCNIPTELPRFTTVWETVLLRDSLATADLLPPSVRIREDGGFVVDSFVSSSEVRLGDVCEFCTCFDGPIPELELSPFDWRFELPSRLVRAEVESGRARMTLHNEAGFDVLDDGDGGRGFLLIQFLDTRTGEVGDTFRVERPFPDGDSLQVEFDLAGVSLGSGLVARVSGQTPGTSCDAVPLTPENGFRADIRLEALRADRVLTIITDSDLRIPDRDLDLPQEVADRLRPGEADVHVRVTVDAQLPVATEFAISVAGLHPDLFTERAALWTPVVVPATLPGEALSLSELFLVDLSSLEGSDRLQIATRNRLLGSALVELRGGESIRYSLVLSAEIPSR